jgi:hypothetical protein
MDGLALRQFLMNWQFWILELQFALVVVCTWLLTSAVPPRTSRIYYDEQI